MAAIVTKPSHRNVLALRLEDLEHMDGVPFAVCWQQRFGCWEACVRVLVVVV